MTMAEFVYSLAQDVSAGQNVILNDSITCNRGYVIHRNESGVITLRGIVNNPCGCFARYQILFVANVAVPEGGTADPISVSLAVDGEPIPSTEAISTPAAVGDFGNVTVSRFVTVPRGCCYTIAIENTSDQTITVSNANLIVTRTA